MISFPCELVPSVIRDCLPLPAADLLCISLTLLRTCQEAEEQRKVVTLLIKNNELTTTGGSHFPVLYCRCLLIYLPFLLVVMLVCAWGLTLLLPMFDKLPPYAQRATWAHRTRLKPS